MEQGGRGDSPALFGVSSAFAADRKHTPGAPRLITINDRACTATPLVVGNGPLTLAANVVDEDGHPLTVRFTYWPVRHPDRRTVLTTDNAFEPNHAAVQLDPATLTDGVTYRLEVRADDGVAVSPPSAVCEFTADLTAPAAAPKVSSADYPATGPANGSGGTGMPGTFTFRASGARDVVGFYYSVVDSTQQDTFVAADHRGGSATIQYAPTSYGANVLDVVGVDAAGNRSPLTRYRYQVLDNSPTVSCTPESAVVGVARQCVIAPGTATGVAGYVYWWNDSSARTTVPADADGGATVSVTPPSNPATFQVRAKLGHVVSYTYFFDTGSYITIPAGPDGTATVNLIMPDIWDYYTAVLVYSTDSSGVRSDQSFQSFHVGG